MSCSLPERNVRGMGWPWVVDSGPDQGVLSKQGVCRFHNKETEMVIRVGGLGGRLCRVCEGCCCRQRRIDDV